MSQRSLVAVCMVIAVVAVAPRRATAQAQTSAADEMTSLQMPWGAPDLQGIWNNATMTPLERP